MAKEIIMENKVKRIGYLPRKRALEIIDEISKSESISRSKVVGILVEEALDARGIANFGYINNSKSNLSKSNIFKNTKNKINTYFIYISPDSLRILILFANSISADDIERSNVL